VAKEDNRDPTEARGPLQDGEDRGRLRREAMQRRRDLRAQPGAATKK
jgi:hypothetical protein